MSGNKGLLCSFSVSNKCRKDKLFMTPERCRLIGALCRYTRPPRRIMGRYSKCFSCSGVIDHDGFPIVLLPLFTLLRGADTRIPSCSVMAPQTLILICLSFPLRSLYFPLVLLGATLAFGMCDNFDYSSLYPNNCLSSTSKEKKRFPGRRHVYLGEEQKGAASGTDATTAISEM